MRHDCLFSSRHAHPTGTRTSSSLMPAGGSLTTAIYLGCKSAACQRLMTVPQRNPIRISETKCADCLMRERDGMVAYV